MIVERLTYPEGKKSPLGKYACFKFTHNPMTTQLHCVVSDLGEDDAIASPIEDFTVSTDTKNNTVESALCRAYSFCDDLDLKAKILAILQNLGHVEKLKSEVD